MKVAIITTHAQESGPILRDALRNNGVHCDFFDLKKVDRTDYREYDSVFSYGTSYGTHHKHRFNSSVSVRNCADKTRTFDLLREAGCSTVPYVLRKQNIPKEWEWVVIRQSIGGRKAEGLDYAENIPGQIPNGELFTEYFEHKYEYRITVFNGQVVGRYFKREDAGDWYFELQPKRGFEIMDDHCIRAAKALGIDYVGFDVVANTKKDFRILEGNSAARLTDEAENAIVEYYINL